MPSSRAHSSIRFSRPFILSSVVPISVLQIQWLVTLRWRSQTFMCLHLSLLHSLFTSAFRWSPYSPILHTHLTDELYIRGSQFMDCVYDFKTCSRTEWEKLNPERSIKRSIFWRSFKRHILIYFQSAQMCNTTNSSPFSICQEPSMDSVDAVCSTYWMQTLKWWERW